MLFYHSIFTVKCIGGLHCELLIIIFLIMLGVFCWFFFSPSIKSSNSGLVCSDFGLSGQ